MWTEAVGAQPHGASEVRGVALQEVGGVQYGPNFLVA